MFYLATTDQIKDSKHGNKEYTVIKINIEIYGKRVNISLHTLLVTVSKKSNNNCYLAKDLTIYCFRVAKS